MVAMVETVKRHLPGAASSPKSSPDKGRAAQRVRAMARQPRPSHQPASPPTPGPPGPRSPRTE